MVSIPNSALSCIPNFIYHAGTITLDHIIDFTFQKLGRVTILGEGVLCASGEVILTFPNDFAVASDKPRRGIEPHLHLLETPFLAFVRVQTPVLYPDTKSSLVRR